MKRFMLLVVLYCIIHASGGDFAVSYEGMDKATVTALIQKTYKAPFDFVDQAAYDNFIAAHQPKLR